MVFNSRTIALILGAFVSFTCLLFLKLLLPTNENVLAIFMVCFISTFLSVFAILELLVFKEIRHIQHIFKQIQTQSIKTTPEDLPSQKISEHLYSFANTKEKEIENLKKLESFRREFLADISHELKTPVFSAQGFIHTLLDGAINDVNVRDKFLKKAAKSLDDLNNLVQDLISISQLETGEFKLQLESFDGFLLVNEIIDQLEHRAKGLNVLLDIKYDEEASFNIVGDRHRISQVITNLVTNAVKYGRKDDGGKVTVELKEKKNEIRFSITDQGNGISQEHLDRIFQRFYRVDKSRSKELGGTGLGLAIVKHVLEAHNSKIQVSSKVGKGTTFFFALPKNF